MTRSQIYKHALPPTYPGMTIGLYGGSFNPAHEGHRHVALTSLHHLHLNRIWCLVTPGNPLKSTSELASLDNRLAQTASVMNHPRIDLTGIEEKAGTRYTAETLDWIFKRCPSTRFVWIMGADNLKQFDQWQHWQDIMRQTPLAIIDRPGYSLSALNAKAAHFFASSRLRQTRAALLAKTPPPSWIFLYGPRCNISSTQLRQAAKR